jgi:hypothetical protein
MEEASRHVYNFLHAVSYVHGIKVHYFAYLAGSSLILSAFFFLMIGKYIFP